MSLLSVPNQPTTTVPASGVAVVWFEVLVRRRRNLPSSITHGLTVSVAAGLPVPRTITTPGRIRSGRSSAAHSARTAAAGRRLDHAWQLLRRAAPSSSIQPVDGKLYLGQRFAIDWNGMGAQRRFVVGDPDLNRSWVFYGKPVLAVDNATVGLPLTDSLIRFRTIHCR